MYFRRIRSSGLLLSFCALILLSSCGTSANGQGSSLSTTNGLVRVVAAENFYGDIVKQVGGTHVSVTSMLSDPNIDPHSYESSVNQVKAIAQAQLVVANGGGYDDWMDNLLASTQANNQTVLKGYDIAPVKLSNNEHVWYDPTNAKAIAAAVASALKTIDASHATDYERNLHIFQNAVGTIDQKLASIKDTYAQTPVGLTETIYLYQTRLMNLKVLTPQGFQKAMAEGNDPPADTVVTTNNQVNQHQVKVLIYNQQTQSSITTRLQKSAQQQHIPVVAVTELMPPDQNYQSWMLSQLSSLEHALGNSK
ncbi:metal ABC transporter solute-binding protein, Zn/Mn family [Dictyobacter arantiisoli]|uniref:ABC transporter substrate-binding protein n=1 Tax=Dictyobacter arantiisoli TaxID=2014874 RepID=A0A5A5TBX0_9CHLR|nr:zinc ABC transporter substrate-binding protein [Dictyobacter arantiisoli]GCF08725.1 ABC transporter substrate-binding protein [Dictyobacter arantiisoli]